MATAEEPRESELMQKIVSLCKRRGFVFQSSEIYGGLRSAYDYGPMGVELKRNLMSEWWRFMVHSREDVVGIDASIIMHPDVWKSSGHLANFSDPLVDCKVCGERFRADKAKAPPRMRLIGLDATLYSRTWAHDGSEMSWNLLTGDIVASQLKLVGKGEDASYDKQFTRKSKRPVTTVYMEDTPDPEEELIRATRAK